jgi:hypothetical protein
MLPSIVEAGARRTPEMVRYARRLECAPERGGEAGGLRIEGDKPAGC